MLTRDEVDALALNACARPGGCDEDTLVELARWGDGVAIDSVILKALIEGKLQFVRMDPAGGVIVTNPEWETLGGLLD